MALETSKALFGKQLDEICDQMGIPKHEAFARWICENILGITGEGKIDEAVSIGGKNDYGVDVFHADEGGDATERYVCWIQAKFSETLDHRVTREEMESFASTLGHLRKCPDLANRTFKQKSAEFVKMADMRPPIKKRMIFAVAGTLNDQVRSLINDEQWKRDRLEHGSGSNVHLEILDLDDILLRMTTPHTPNLKIRFDGDILRRTDALTRKQSIIGHVHADSLVDLAKRHRETLFLENPRQTLGDNAPTHKAILNTLSDPDERQRFWKLNNGITAICTKLSSDPGDDRTYDVENFKIVNGRQTTHTLERSAAPIDDVLLLMTIHEAVDDRERNQISEATNTQNPIKPVDLVTNYPEMTNLALQCRKDFPDFYFERQTKGFSAARKSVQNRVTTRRVMEKGPTARAYYAYAINPSDATVPDKVMFSGASEPNHYEMIFKDRNIRDLIIPHIFMHMLTALHRKWCKELRDSPSDEASRKKGIISKDMVKYYILRFVYESMVSIDEPTRESIKDSMIEQFRNLQKHDDLPETFLEIAQAAYDIFMFSFDSDKSQTWPKELLEKIRDDRRHRLETDVPSPYDMMHALKQNGARLLPHLLLMRKHVITQFDDQVRLKLLKLHSPQER